MFARSRILLFAIVAFFLPMAVLAQNPDGPKLGEVFKGKLIDKSGDAVLQQLIENVAPNFGQGTLEEGAEKFDYNLFIPKKLDIGKKYPLLVFIGDASTTGPDVRRPLVQGYGALVWGTDEFQVQNPCYILVPQFAGVAVNDAYERAPSVDQVLRLVEHVINTHAIDPARVYITGQSMGGMIAMYLTISKPDIFAAAMFVDCHWDSAGFKELVRHPFIFVNAGNSGKSAKCREEIEKAARAEDISYAWMEWSARLPQKTQDELAATLLGKGEPINLITFESGTVLPQNGKGSEHMYSFDYAYKLAPCRDWLFEQTLK